MAYYLLDSDAVVDHLKGVASSTAVIEQLVNRGNIICTCDIVLAEVHSGLSVNERPSAEAFLQTLTFLRSSVDIARQAGIWRYEFRRRGVAVATTDAIIAATGYFNHATIVTRNTRHFPMPEIAVMPLPASSR